MTTATMTQAPSWRIVLGAVLDNILGTCGNGPELAAALLASDFSIDYQDFGNDDVFYNVVVTAPARSFDLLKDCHFLIDVALSVSNPTSIDFRDLRVFRAAGDVPDPVVIPLSNHARGARKVTWGGLGFRSETELRIAQALEKAAVLFLPNCRARLGGEADRRVYEPDFLVCHDGVWGVLEVHGSKWHGPERKVDEEERARFLRRHGIRVVEHYDATVCFATPDMVVEDFLALLSRNG